MMNHFSRSHSRKTSGVPRADLRQPPAVPTTPIQKLNPYMMCSPVGMPNRSVAYYAQPQEQVYWQNAMPAPPRRQMSGSWARLASPAPPEATTPMMQYDVAPIKPTFRIYARTGDFFLRDVGALELMIALLGGYTVRRDLDLNDETSQEVLRGMFAGHLYNGSYALVSDGVLLCEFSSAARYIARRLACYCLPGQADYVADACLMRLELWRRDQDLALQLATTWLEGGCQTQIPSEIQGYIECRHFFYDILAFLFRSWNLLYRDPTSNTNWIDPLIFARLLDDRFLDQHIRLHSNLKFKDSTNLSNNHGGVIRSYYEMMLRSHQKTFEPIVARPCDLAYPADLTTTTSTNSIDSRLPEHQEKELLETPLMMNSKKLSQDHQDENTAI